MTVRLRALRDEDESRVLQLNQEHVAVLSPMDAGRLQQLRGWAQRFDVIEHIAEGREAPETRVDGFVIVVAPGTAYDSAKYRWFSQVYSDFLYLDRIVLDSRVHRRGLGNVVYDAVEADAAASGRLCLEVDIDPPNVASLSFHARRGFREVARLGGPGEAVSMQVKELSADGARGGSDDGTAAHAQGAPGDRSRLPQHLDRS